jgi:hypothetical protein
VNRLQTWVFGTKVLAALAAGALTAGLALITAKKWDASDQTVLAMSVAAGVLAFVAASSAAWTDFRGRRRRQLGDHVATHARATFWNVHDATKGKIDPKDLGVAIYLVSWDRPRLKRLRPYWKRKRLKRLHRERPRHHNETTGLIWRPGKGVIGACVERFAVSHSDVGAIWAPHRTATAVEWSTIDDSGVTQGLSHAEFRSLVDGGKRLGAVIATPILKDGKVVGCVAVDGPSGSAEYNALCQQRVRDALADTAAAIAMLL